MFLLRLCLRLEPRRLIRRLKLLPEVDEGRVGVVYLVDRGYAIRRRGEDVDVVLELIACQAALERWVVGWRVGGCGVGRWNDGTVGWFDSVW